MSAADRYRFETTRWSLVIAAGGDRSSAARRALADLCEAYWYPLYSYVRRQGAEEARDLTQSFFVVLLEIRARVAKSSTLFLGLTFQRSITQLGSPWRANVSSSRPT